MADRYELFPSEYQYEYSAKKFSKSLMYRPRDKFAERVENWQIDIRTKSKATPMDETTDNLIKKLRTDNNRSVYQISFPDPVKKCVSQEKDFATELLSYLHNLYFDPHNEKVLSPPVTSKRVYGYIRPRHLRAKLSTYQDVHGRVGGNIVLKNTPIDTKEIMCKK